MGFRCWQTSRAPSRAIAGMLPQVLIREWYACGSMNIISVAMASKETDGKAINAAWGTVCAVSSLNRSNGKQFLSL